MVYTKDIAPDMTVIDAVRRLTAVEKIGSDHFITVPALYPSGSTAVVRVRDDGKDYLVSDIASGWGEVEEMGGTTHIYNGIAKKIAESYGIAFDNQEFFIGRIGVEQLTGAIMTVASCSVEAATQASYSMAERRAQDDNEKLYVRLVKVFTPRSIKVVKDVKVIGASNHEWSVAALVKGDHSTIFETVANHGTSVATVATKFADISRTDRSPRRVAVVKSKSELGTYLGVISPVASVIEADAADRTIIRAAA
jgi:hypothetical protein